MARFWIILIGLSLLEGSMRNDVQLMTYLDDETQATHFKLREFENKDGLAMLDDSTLLSLEMVRAELCEMADEEVCVIITDAVRTPEDLVDLAEKYGWISEGGTVSETSRHLAEFGGIAVDIKARIKRNGMPIPQKTLGDICRHHFDWVKDDYGDGHVHADNRIKGEKQ